MPTLDYKGRINKEMFDYYPDMSKKLNTILYGMTYEERQEIVEQMLEYSR